MSTGSLSTPDLRGEREKRKEKGKRERKEKAEGGSVI